MSNLRATKKRFVGACTVLLLLSSSVNSEAFNWDTDIAPLWLVAPYEVPAIYAISPTASDASIVLRITTLLANAWFDAIAPYHPTAVGVYSRINRRPAIEGATNRNKNIAIMYASYRILNNLLPQNAKEWRAMMQAAELNPDDASKDTTTAVGIGNVAGSAVAAAREHDGMNQLGDEGGQKYNRRPYADYTGYMPVNTPWELIDPSRWQPQIVTKGDGLFQAQQFVTPQWARTLPYTFMTPEKFHAPGPQTQDPGGPAYMEQVDIVLAVSAGLIDRQKVVAELFNDKVMSLGVIPVWLNLLRGYTLEQYVYERFMVGVAVFDAGIVTWKEKARYDAVRPTSAIRYLYAGKKISAWGGPGKGTVSDMPGAEWKSYLNVADHPEYPSGSGCFCSAHAQAARRLEGGSDQFNILWPIMQGSSKVEPGITPHETMFLYWPTWTAYVEDCKMSRVYGGVHFLATQEDSVELCSQFGDMAYEFTMDLINGKVKGK